MKTPWEKLTESEDEVLLKTLRNSWTPYIDTMEVAQVLTKNKMSPTCVSLGVLHAAAHLWHALEMLREQSDEEILESFPIIAEAVINAHLVMVKEGNAMVKEGKADST